jgi:hypothetical protein
MLVSPSARPCLTAPGALKHDSQYAPNFPAPFSWTQLPVVAGWRSRCRDDEPALARMRQPAEPGRRSAFHAALRQTALLADAPCGNFPEISGKKYQKFNRIRGKICPSPKLAGQTLFTSRNKNQYGNRPRNAGKNLGVQCSIICRSAKNFDRMAKKKGQNACPITVARKMVSRFVLRTSRESV